MKKVLATLLTALCVTSCVWAGTPSRVESLVKEYRQNDGFEVLSLGRFGLSLLKIAAAASGEMDEEDRAILAQFNNIKGITIVDFEDASEAVKADFAGKLEKMLGKMELILEAKDSGEAVRIYGVDNGNSIGDCILYSRNGALICTRGSIETDKLGELLEMAQ